MVATGFALVDSPNRNYAQGRPTRRNGAKVSGTGVFHSFEMKPDLGLGPAIDYLQNRVTPGCYHRLSGLDGRQPLYPFEWETWHCRNTNNWSVGLCSVTVASWWPDLPGEQADTLLLNMAKDGADFVVWAKDQGITVPIRWIDGAAAMRREPGFTTHGQTDPTRRSDPFGRYAARYMPSLIELIGDLVGSGHEPAIPVGKGRMFLPLVIDGIEGHRTVTETERALYRTGDYAGQIEEDLGLTARRGPMLAAAEQRWLKRIGWYPGAVDGDFGPVSILAEQRWLQSIGLYGIALNREVRGEVVIRGLQSALNIGFVR